jgi:hypothetical protein
MVSMLGEREKAGVCVDTSGGNEVWRRGWVEAEVVDIIEALRLLACGMEVPISVCRLLGAWGRGALVGYGGESAEVKCA